MQPSNGSKDSSAPVPEKTGAAGGNQQFCLRWNNYQSNLTNVFDQLLQNGTFVDVTIACDGHTLKAHKIVLSACSPYFQSMLAENKCKHPIVILKDVQWPELRAVVDFMYKGEINVYQEQIGPLLRVAETLKVRGLADVSNEQLTGGGGAGEPQTAAAATVVTPAATSAVAAPESPKQPARKRHRLSCSPETIMSEPGQADTPLNLHHMPPPAPAPHHPTQTSSIPQAQHQQQQHQQHQHHQQHHQHHHHHQQQQQQQQHHQQQQHQQQQLQQQQTQQSSQHVHQQQQPAPPPPPPPQSSIPPPLPPSSVADDLEIKPGIAEMIREEERAKMFESSQAWLASTSSPMTSDSYQYQLQSMWQKCWNTNQSLVHNLRFRERGPLKSWRPETMAEAILSVLKEGLSLSQAARKYDIPYPTFVLYANRVHNLLGPSADGGADLRPKGRGRPQRILLGFWPEDHIQNVIRTVVFRDAQNIKEEALHLYPRLPCLPDPISGGHYGNNSLPSGEGPVSPNSAAAAVVAVAQGIRQQMMAAAGHNISPSSGVDAFALLASSHLPSPADMSPNSTPPDSPLVSNNNVEVSLSGYKRSIDGHHHNHNHHHHHHSNQDSVFVEDIDELVKNSHCSGGSSMNNTIDQQPLPLVIEQRTD